MSGFCNRCGEYQTRNTRYCPPCKIIKDRVTVVTARIPEKLRIWATRTAKELGINRSAFIRLLMTNERKRVIERQVDKNIKERDRHG